jgi:hypothetical protein
MPGSGKPRQSGLTAAQESALEGGRDLDTPLDSNIEQHRKFRSPGFSRMRTEWRPEDSIILTKAKTAAEDRLVLEFADAYRVLARIYDIVRTPATTPEGEIQKDRHGWTVWAKDEYGSYIEDWSRLTTDKRDTILFTLATRLYDWEQKAADAWGEAMFAKGQWEETYSIGFDEPMTGTVQDREATGRIKSADERYFAIQMTFYSRKADALVRSMTRIADRLRDTLLKR